MEEVAKACAGQKRKHKEMVPTLEATLAILAAKHACSICEVPLYRAVIKNAYEIMLNNVFQNESKK
jgi:predicted nucleic acid-binding protein